MGATARSWLGDPEQRRIPLARTLRGDGGTVEITAGALPFRGVGLDVLAAKLRNAAPALSTVRGSLVTIPVELAIARGLDRRPAGRPRTASDLLDAVEAALGAGG